MISPLYSMLCPPLFPLFSCLVSPPPRSYFLDTPFYSLFPFSCLSCFPYLSYTALRAQYTYILYSTFQQKACLLRGGNNISPALPHSIPLSFMISPCASLSLSLIILLHSQVSWMPTGSSRPGTAGQRERRKEVLERKEEEEKEGVASLGCLRQHPCQSQPQAPPFPLPLPHTPPPWDGGGGSGGRGRWRQWMLQQQYQE